MDNNYRYKVENYEDFVRFCSDQTVQFSAILFSAEWFPRDSQLCSQQSSCDTCGLDEIRKELDAWKETKVFDYCEIDIDNSEAMKSSDNEGQIITVPTIQFFDKTSSSMIEVPSVDGSRSRPWDLSQDRSRYDLVGACRQTINEIRMFLGQATSQLHVPQGQETAGRALTEYVPAELQKSWKELQSIHEDALKLCDGGQSEYGGIIGIPQSCLSAPGNIMYHHRAGLNNILSENFEVSFSYKGRKWSSVQQAYQAAKFDCPGKYGSKVAQWISEATSMREVMSLAREYHKYAKEDFSKDGNNLQVMYDITFNKFYQNPRLAQWLVDTDPDGRKPPIFHTSQDSGFWDLGELAEPESPAAGSPISRGGSEGSPCGRYLGRNMNGQILVCVREVLRGALQAQPQPFRMSAGDASEKELRENLEALGKAVLRPRFHPVGATSRPTKPLVAGSLIDKRYRVLGHRRTAGLGAFAGEYSYVCRDERPMADPLEARLESLLRNSICAQLRCKLSRLQGSLCSGRTLEAEWEEVFQQVENVIVLLDE